jgi:hypothetical protein
MSDHNQPDRPLHVGSMPAGLEEPPRLDPIVQRAPIPQTYDPRVSVQLERAARDRASGQPGSAAREDLERAMAEPDGGARLLPEPALVSGGGEPRETVVTFATQFASYFPGESAAFTEDEAARLAELGVTGEGGGGGGAPTEAPVNVTVPHVSQAADVLSCTMGTWDGEPTAYAYQWQMDGADVGTDAATHTVTAGDVGLTATCIVTATNAIGSTTAPPSNGLIVVAGS